MASDHAEVKLLTLDIESSPLITYTWGLRDQNIGIKQIIRVPEMMCWSAKYHEKTRVYFKSTFHHGKEEMLETLHNLLSDCDAVIHYNGKSFDIKHINREFDLANFLPPAPYKQIDLYLQGKKHFRYSSHKLDQIAKELGIGAKVENGGWDLWIACMNGKRKAWSEMREYNIGDVLLTEKLYERWLPVIDNHPSRSLELGADVCPNCGSGDLERRGYAMTTLSRFQRFQCRGCGHWCRSTIRDRTTSIVQIAG